MRVRGIGARHCGWTQGLYLRMFKDVDHINENHVLCVSHDVDE